MGDAEGNEFHNRMRSRDIEVPRQTHFISRMARGVCVFDHFGIRGDCSEEN